MEYRAEIQSPNDGGFVSGSEEAARFWLSEGCRQERIQDWEGAIESYRRAQEAESSDPLVRYFANNNLGYSLLQMGRYDEAEEYCEAAIEINPAQYNAHKNLGLARAGQGRWLDAALSLVEASRLCPENTRAWLHLQKLLSEKPALIDQSAELENAVAKMTAHYEAAGSIPRFS